MRSIEEQMMILKNLSVDYTDPDLQPENRTRQRKRKKVSGRNKWCLPGSNGQVSNNNPVHMVYSKSGAGKSPTSLRPPLSVCQCCTGGEDYILSMLSNGELGLSNGEEGHLGVFLVKLTDQNMPIGTKK